MASSSHATLLFPRGARDAFDDDDDDDRPSARHLDSVGALAVLGAMVEQRRQYYPPPPPPSIDVDLTAFEAPDGESDGEVDDTAVTETHQRPVASRRSIGFLKIR